MAGRCDIDRIGRAARVGGGWLGLALGLLLAGCASPRIERTLGDIPIGEAYEPTNLYAVEQLPASLRQVVVLPVHASPDLQVDTATMRARVLSELRKAGRFEVLELSPERLDQLVGRESFSSQAPFPPAVLNYVVNELGADGVLQAEITNYRPYRPMVVGVRARLFDAGSGKPLWVIDEVFDAGSRKVDVAARRYSLDEAHQRYPYTDSYAALRGPGAFSGFVLYTVFQTLPPLAQP